MRELELIKHIKKQFSNLSSSKSLILPIGDDCSVIKPPKGKLQVTTADSLVEGNHFSSMHFTPREIGRKVIRVNLSDLASMGAEGPYYAWLTFAIPQNLSDSLLKGIISGIKSDCEKYGITLAGGNITSSSEFSIHLTLTGWTKENAALKRGGARKGDSIYVTGTIGASTLAYKQFKAGKTPQDFLRKRWANPTPRIEAGIFLAKKEIASSCIDVSDGIFQDLGQLLKASSVGAKVEWSALPIHPKLKKMNPTPDMIGNGEDYELLFTVPDKKTKLLSNLPVKITRIGEITENGFSVTDSKGEEIDVRGIGYSHLI